MKPHSVKELSTFALRNARFVVEPCAARAGVFLAGWESRPYCRSNAECAEQRLHCRSLRIELGDNAGPHASISA